MSDEYQLRKDVDRIYTDIYTLRGDVRDNELNVYTKDESDTKYYDKSEVDVKLNQLIDIIYPVGAIYISVNSVNPSNLFGGVWEQIEDKFLLASGTDYDLGDTGGEATHKLTISEMPSHNHKEHGVWSTGSGSSSGYTYQADRSVNTRTTDNTGGGQAHNNMPPYLVVNIWERIE